MAFEGTAGGFPPTDTGAATPGWPSRLAKRLGVVRDLVGFLLLLWVVEILDTVLLGSRLQRNGIGPRDFGDLDGVLWAPFLHSNFGHIASNTVPLAVLGGLVGIRGRSYWYGVTISTAVLGGSLVWLLAGDGNHIGASGVAFGYLGALLGAAAKSRRPASLAPAGIAVFLYGSMLAGIVPTDSISWEGHLFGLLVGLLVGYRFTSRPAPPVDEPMYDWELDEPWKVDPDDAA
jgi:membrane associated rhomboid family serine protease